MVKKENTERKKEFKWQNEHITTDCAHVVNERGSMWD